MKNKIICLIISCMISTSMVVQASPLNDKLNNEKQKLESNKQSYNSVLGELGDMEAKSLALNCEVNELKALIESTDKDILKKESEIVKNEKDIVLQQKKVDKQADLIVKKVKRTYMNNSTDNQMFFEVLLESKSIKDFSQKFKAIDNIMENNKKMLDKYITEKDKLGSKKQILADDKNALIVLKKTYEDKQLEFEKTKRDYDSVIKDLNDKKVKYKSEIDDNEAKINRIVDEIKAANVKPSAPSNQGGASNGSGGNSGSSNSGGGSKPSNGSVTGNDIVNYALSFRGVPYVWGGTTPNGFDCSGLVQYVYRHFGISMSRTTYTQIKDGAHISKGNEQPGDLVFFGDVSAPYHVGIYIGGGQYVHAPQTGDVVKVSSLAYSSSYSAARRYL